MIIDPEQIAKERSRAAASARRHAAWWDSLPQPDEATLPSSLDTKLADLKARRAGVIGEMENVEGGPTPDWLERLFRLPDPRTNL